LGEASELGVATEARPATANQLSTWEGEGGALAPQAAAEEAGVSYRIGEPVAQEGGLDWALMNPQQRIDTVVEKYEFNLQGKTVSYDDSLGTGQFGATAKATPMNLRIGPDALASEQETAATIAHELRHSRAYLGSGSNTEAAAGASENAISELHKPTIAPELPKKNKR
jgi:hypothetical protein